MAKVGVLYATTPTNPVARDADGAFRQGLRELGYADGENIILEYRWADGKPDRFPELVADLIRIRVEFIVTSTIQRQAGGHVDRDQPGQQVAEPLLDEDLEARQQHDLGREHHGEEDQQEEPPCGSAQLHELQRGAAEQAVRARERLRHLEVIQAPPDQEPPQPSRPLQRPRELA